MKEITVAVIGSGSTYCPELVDGFIKAQSSLKLKKISFMDIDERKRTIVGNLCLRMLKKAGIECETLLTDNFMPVILTRLSRSNMTSSVRRPPVSAASSRLCVLFRSCSISATASRLSAPTHGSSTSPILPASSPSSCSTTPMSSVWVFAMSRSI